MFLSRAVSSRFVCNSCRKASQSTTVFNSKRVTTHASRKSILESKALQRTFSTGFSRYEESRSSLSEDSESALLDEGTELSTSAIAGKSTTSSVEVLTPSTAPTQPSQPTPVPWYLRTQASVPSPVQPAQVPDLPSNPPPLLETLLEYVSVTAGLDDLQLLDLRHLDPPPALGPKLIMIIGTARSEKHLHVAADRFCRYLRREHSLKANAAGLLGRNELKIKLRRKAKRMRMLANVGGAAPEGNIDDGIRTGWICCTLGKIEAHSNDMHMPGDNVQEFVGFREVKPGVNVVVQMFTEEKRVETDLETLWGGVLRTHQRRDQSAGEALQELEQDIEELELEDSELEEVSEAKVTAQSPNVDRAQDSPGLTPAPQFYRPRPSPGDAFPSAMDSGPRRQLRRLHTLGFR